MKLIISALVLIFLFSPLLKGQDTAKHSKNFTGINLFLSGFQEISKPANSFQSNVYGDLGVFRGRDLFGIRLPFSSLPVSDQPVIKILWQAEMNYLTRYANVQIDTTNRRTGVNEGLVQIIPLMLTVNSPPPNSNPPLKNLTISVGSAFYISILAQQKFTALDTLPLPPPYNTRHGFAAYSKIGFMYDASIKWHISESALLHFGMRLSMHEFSTKKIQNAYFFRTTSFYSGYTVRF